MTVHLLSHSSIKLWNKKLAQTLVCWLMYTYMHTTSHLLAIIQFHNYSSYISQFNQTLVRKIQRAATDKCLLLIFYTESLYCLLGSITLYILCSHPCKKFSNVLLVFGEPEHKVVKAVWMSFISTVGICPVVTLHWYSNHNFHHLLNPVH